jgi:hypothetical protein
VASQWFGGQDEPLQRSLAPLVAGMTSLSQQLRSIEDQAQVPSPHGGTAFTQVFSAWESVVLLPLSC